jgi:hypothetical protein
MYRASTVLKMSPIEFSFTIYTPLVITYIPEETIIRFGVPDFSSP